MADQNDMREAILRTLSGENLPQEPSPYGGAYTYWEPRYQEMSPMRRGLAGIANMVSGMPLVRNTGLPDMISSPGDREIATGARPGLSRFEAGYGSVLPFALFGTGPYIHSRRGDLVADIPPIMFGSIPRSTVSNTGISALDAYGANEDVRGAATRGAIAGFAGALPAKMITPRSLEGVASVNRRAIDDARMLQAGQVPQGLSSPLGAARRGALGNEFGVSPLDRAAYNWYSNTTLSPESRALLNALASGVLQEPLK